MEKSVETPVVEPKKPNASKGPSLRDKIKAAKTAGEVRGLLVEGKTYTNASRNSVRRWEEAAKAKLHELEAK